LILEKVNYPEDLKTLSLKELEQLAQELRSFIIETVEKTGGHLASSLGVVELTIALLRVFSPPKDEIVWDVGHQSYPYKILTGRRELFPSLRQHGGLCGFPSIKESIYDAFGTGHSSTSISAALGIKVAKRLKGEEGHVIAVIGDGALTAGEAYEGLNNAGQLGEDLIVILNDNEMSISKNIGAISNYLTKLTTGESLRRAKERLEEVTKKIFGQKVYSGLKRVEDLVVKGLFPPGMLFEELGFRYVGPIDGHDLKTLETTLKNVSKMHGPTLVHVLTKKGKGYKPAEERPEKFHGVSPTPKEKKEKLPPTYTEVFSKTLVELAEKDDRIVAITAAMPSGTGLDRFKEAFPKRYFDVGIAEQHAVTFAAGLAKKGLRPVVAIYSTFLQRAYDQIIHDVALQELPVIFAIDRAGLVGEDGATHHGLFDLSYLRAVPGLVVSAAKDEAELRDLLLTAINSGRPFAVRYPRGRGYGVPLREPKEVPIGEWEVLREGGDVAVIATGWPVLQALRAAEELEEEGINITVVNARFVKPIDVNRLEEILKNHRVILTVEENTIVGGLGSAVAEFLAEGSFEGRRLKRLGIPDTFVEHASQELQRSLCGIDSEGIKKAVRESVER